MKVKIFLRFLGSIILIINFLAPSLAFAVQLHQSAPNSLTPGAPPNVGPLGVGDDTDDDLIITFTTPVTAAGLIEK